jgi:hypothetical protein
LEHYAAKDLTRLKQMGEVEKVFKRMLANAGEIAEAAGAE